MFNVQTAEGAFGSETLKYETGKLAGLADGAVTARYGDTVVLVTAVVGDQKPGFDYFPMMVSYEEKMYAAGKISGGFFKREGRPSEEATLISRQIDRPIRPLFPKNCRNDIQVIATVLSVDGIHHPDVVAMNAASTALHLAGAPMAEMIGAARIGEIDGELVVNPTESQREQSKLDLVVAGTKDKVMMVEAGASEVTEERMLKAFDLALAEIKKAIAIQEELVGKVAPEKREAALAEADPDLERDVAEKARAKLLEITLNSSQAEREKKVAELTGWLEEELIPEEAAEDPKWTHGQVKDAFTKVEQEVIREAVLGHDVRPDGRKLAEIRPISCEIGVLPRTHGSAIFTRGQTQALTLTTLGTPGDQQIIDTMLEDTKRRYMHHYNFPPFSVGEARPVRGPGRREIGHGSLAERALLPMIPDQEDFPYTMRLVSEILASNGSTSMASVCGSTLSLMDAGVPIKKPVSGIAMGLVTDGDTTKVLTDIQGAEDFAGDMDFKVAGTKDGITALQMDMKVHGIPLEVMTEALEQAKTARLEIMEKMLAAIPEPRKDLAPHAPRITSMKIDPEKIRIVIGPGGKTINEITQATGVTIDLEDDGTVMIGSTEGEGAQKAIDWIEALTAEPEVGKVYDGKVTKLMPFGAFVEFMPGKEGMVHVSQISDERVATVEDALKVGQEVKVMVIEVDSQGRNNLSIKAAKNGADAAAVAEEVRQARAPRNGGGRDRRGPGGPPRGRPHR
ncbi:MAG: polyribonucleotide nucleotidyltransferase [Patescibacteria group bacterium]